MSVYCTFHGVDATVPEILNNAESLRVYCRLITPQEHNTGCCVFPEEVMMSPDVYIVSKHIIFSLCLSNSSCSARCIIKWASFFHIFK